MFYGATISTDNYDALLNGWSAQKLRKGVKFDGGNSHYCNGEAARNHIIDSARWQLKDGGKLCGDGLRITKKVTAFKRSMHRYKLRVTNRSAILRHLNVTIQDKLPKGYIITNISDHTATCLQNGRAVTCTQTQLEPGMSIVIKVWATSDSATGKNCATVTSDTPDPDLQDNKACVAVP